MARLLNLEGDRPLDLARAVESGLPYRAFDRLRESLDWQQSEAARLIQIKDRTLNRRKDAGRFKPEESDHLVRASRIVALATQLFEGDKRQAKHWLESPQQALDGRKPVDLACTDVGAREVERLIQRLEHGVFT